MTNAQTITNSLTALSNKLNALNLEYLSKAGISQEEMESFVQKKDNIMLNLKRSINEIKNRKFRQFVLNKIEERKFASIEENPSIDKFYYYLDSLNKVKTLKSIFKYNKTYCQTIMNYIVSMYFGLENLLIKKIDEMEGGIGTLFQLYTTKCGGIIDDCFSNELDEFAKLDAIELLKKEIPEYEALD